MNFLAHAYLSLNDPNLIVGNLIADVVRGKQIESFPDEVRKGIILHRAIDEFTDSHPVNKEAKYIFRQVAGRYDSSFLDVSYDHFLALDEATTPPEGWKAFAQKCYEAIEQRGEILPQIFCNFYIYMRSEDWLGNYTNRWMIQQSFERLKRRANYLDNDTPVFGVFEQEYVHIGEAYAAFFPDLKKFVEEECISR